MNAPSEPTPALPPFVVDAEQVAEEEGHYPPPFDGEQLSFGRNLGKATGSRNVGMWRERIPPGRRTSFTHAHTHQEELVYVLSGRPTLRLREPGRPPREVRLHAGHTVAFPPGTGIAHTLFNEGPEEAVVLAFGERQPEDRCHYPDDPAYDAHRKATRPASHWDGIPDIAAP